VRLRLGFILFSIFLLTLTLSAHAGAFSDKSGTPLLSFLNPLAAGFTATPVTFSTTEGQSFTGTVANFTDGSTHVASDYTATINWGDGTTTAGTVSGSSGSFSVSGLHTYADEGAFTVPVTITRTADSAQAIANSTANVAEGDSLTALPKIFGAATNQSFSGQVAGFTDTFLGNVASDFTATIDWGDGTTTAGTVTGSAGSFNVSGAHTYSSTGTFAVKVTLTDDPPGTATATANSTASVCASLTTPCPIGVMFAATEFMAFNGTVAHFTDGSNLPPSDYTATIDWGDGTTSVGTVSGSNNSFDVTGSHTYADEGTFTVPVTITRTTDNAHTVATSTASVAEGDSLTGTPKTFSAVKNQPFSGQVAGFTDTPSFNVASDFTATIDWGDGTTTAGTVSGSAGSFDVSGTHTYNSDGTFAVKVTLTDDPPGTATATVTSTANVCTSLIITCPASITKFTDSGQLTATVNPGTPVASDSCSSVVSVTGVRSDGKPLNAPYPIGVTTITWTAKDASNHTASCGQTIAVMVPSGQRRIP